MRIYCIILNNCLFIRLVVLKDFPPKKNRAANEEIHGPSIEYPHRQSTQKLPSTPQTLLTRLDAHVSSSGAFPVSAKRNSLLRLFRESNHQTLPQQGQPLRC